MLVTNVGGLAEIVPHNKVGYVCDMNIHQIVDCIVEFYSENKEEEFSVNTKIEKKRFSWELLVKGVDNLMKKQL